MSNNKYLQWSYKDTQADWWHDSAIVEELEDANELVREVTGQGDKDFEVNTYISELEFEMELAARNLQFEKAAEIRDKIKELKVATGH